MTTIIKTGIPNLQNYDTFCSSFTWERESKNLEGLKNGNGLNIAHEAVVRHANSELKNKVALRWIRQDYSIKDLTYAELNILSSRFANSLERLGVQKGESVFSLTGRIPELIIAALGTLKKTAVFCPLFSVFGPEPVFQRLRLGEASVLITTTLLYEKKIKQLIGRLPHLKYIILVDTEKNLTENILSFSSLMSESSDEFNIPHTDPQDPALLHFTSGTTGLPKGALHVHQAVVTHYMTGKYVLDFHPDDMFWCTADPGWVTGTSYGIISPLVNGITNIFDEAEFDAIRWYSILQDQKITVWYTSPTAIRRLMRLDSRVRNSFKLNHLRLILSVGEPLHSEAVIWCEKTFGIPVLDNWWQTETGGIMISNFLSMPVKPGSMGKPLPGVEVSIAEITETGLNMITEPGLKGHLILKNNFPSMFRAYLHDEDRYKKCFFGDWYLTGDLVKRDADGYFWFIGRADDIIKTSGHMVGPFEVESMLMQHPAVAEAAVIGIPDPLIGEIVKAFVILKNGYETNENTKLDIIGFARKTSGPVIAPKEIVFVDVLPKTKSGKILRRLLKARELGLPEGDVSTLETT